LSPQGDARAARPPAVGLRSNAKTTPTSNEAPTSADPRVADLPGGFSESELPRRIGYYLILKRLGRGGMGEVLLGQRDDDQFHKRVAIKLIRRGIDDATDGQEILKRFELERQVLAALNHPNIARLIDAGQMPPPDDRPYFVMEYVDGEPIDEYCDRMQLTIQHRLEMFQKVCAAVHHAHQNLIVHRDIKPGNILVDPNGEPKLMDFGIAKLLNPSFGNIAFATQFDLGPMTPEYASPEQVQGKPITTSSDVYALGVLLYELLTGRRPYAIKSRVIEEIRKRIMEDDPERPSTAVMHELVEPALDGSTRTVNAASLAKPREGEVTRLKRKLAGDIDNIVLMALRKSPQRRYPSAAAFAEDIQRHIDGQPVKAHPETVAYVASKFILRNRFTVAAATLVLLSIVGGGVGAGIAWRRELAARTATVKLLASAVTALDQSRGSVGQLAAIGPADDATAIRGEALKQFRKGIEDFAKTVEEVDVPSAAGVLDPLRGRALTMVGQAQANIRGASSGDVAAAVKSLEAAKDLLSRASEASSQDGELRRSLAATHIALGDAYRRTPGKSEQSAAEYEHALTSARAAMQLGQPADGTRRTLAVALVASGDAATDAGDWARAKSLFEQSLVERRALAAADPSDRSRRRDLSTGLGRAADAALAGGDATAAEKLFREALGIRESLLSEEPSMRAQRDIAIMSAKLAGMLRAKSPPEVDQARELLNRQRTICRALWDADPANKRAWLDWCRSLNDVADLELEQAAFDVADTTATTSIEHGTALVNSDPKNTQSRWELARAYELHARSLRGLKRNADSAYSKALELYRALARDDPKIPAFREAVDRVNAETTASQSRD